MALLRRLLYKKPPDHLLEISNYVYVFDCCFSSHAMGEDEYKLYLGGIVAQLQNHFQNFSFIVFNFKEGEQPSEISEVLSPYNNITVLDYPRHYQSCPLLPLGMIHHFLKSSQSWLSLEGQHNVLLMHCETGGWPVLAFMLAGLLLYIEQYQGEQKTLEMVHKQAPQELLQILSPLNPQPSQLRYLHYISRRNLGPDWPPSDKPLLLRCLILRCLPHFEVTKGCRPILRVYGEDPEDRDNSSSILLFPTPNTNRHTRLYQQEECIQVELDIQCCVQGDVVLECIHLHDDLVREEMIFRTMFHTAFVRGNSLMLKLDEMDIRWDAKGQFPKEFRAEVCFSVADFLVPTIAITPISEDEEHLDNTSPEEFYEVEETFSDSNHKNDVHGEAPFKDITVDDVHDMSDGKVDSNIDPVKDLGIDDGDEQRKRVTMDAKEKLPSLPAASPHQEPPPPPPTDLPSLTKSDLPFSEPAASASPPSQNDSFSQTFKIPSHIRKVLHSIPTPSSYGPPVPPPPPSPPLPQGGPPPPPPCGRAPGLSRPPSGGPPRPPGGGPPLPPGGGPPLPPGPRPPPHLGPGSSAQTKSTTKSFHWVKVTRVVQGSLWFELKRQGVGQIAQEFDESDIETLFSAATVLIPDGGQTKLEVIHLMDDKTIRKTEIMLSKIKMPLPDMPAAILRMDETVLDIDLIEKFIMCCPTKENMEILTKYAGDKTRLGKCEKFFLELMKVPQVKSKLNAFSYKIHFNTQISEFKKNVNVVKSACKEVKDSEKLKEIMKRILYLGNILNKGTGKGNAEGFKLDALLKLSDTRAVNSKITLMHYLCKVIADKKIDLLDFHEELGSLESASEIQLNFLDGEMKAIKEGLENANMELAKSETDGPVSEVFHERLKEFISFAEPEVETVKKIYSDVKNKADSLPRYFGDDPTSCPFEQVTGTLLNFTKLFKKAHEENVKEAEMEEKKKKKKATEEAKMEKAKVVSLTKKKDKAVVDDS